MYHNLIASVNNADRLNYIEQSKIEKSKYYHGLGNE